METFILLVLLIGLVLLPFVLIIFGILRRHKDNGILLFLFGCGLLLGSVCNFLSEYVAEFICHILYSFGITASFHDTSGISIILFFLFMYLLYKFYRWLCSRKSKSYIKYAKSLISTMEDRKYPSCSHIIVSTLTEVINDTPASNLPADIQHSVAIEIYKITFHYVGVSDYRDTFGELSSQGEQFLAISRNCLDHLYSNKYITSDEYHSMLESLKQQSAPFYNSF